MLPPIVETEDGLRVTNADVQKMLGVSKPTATRLLQKLESLLEQMGHGAGAYYRIRVY